MIISSRVDLKLIIIMLNAIRQYLQFPRHIIVKSLANITNTYFMSAVDLTSGYFQFPKK